MSKFQVAFNLDLSQVAPEALMGPEPIDLEVVKEAVSAMLLSQARKAARDKLHEIRRDVGMDSDVKIIQMSEQIRKVMITLMAEANMTVTQLRDDVEISTELPFERNYQEDQRRVA